MIYLSVSDFRSIASPSGSFNEPTTNAMNNVSKGVPFAVCEFYLSGSSQEIDGALATHHDMDVINAMSASAMPFELRQVCMILTSERLLTYQGMPPEKHGPVLQQYNDIIKKDGFLDRLRAGLYVAGAGKQIDKSQAAVNFPVVSQPCLEFRHYVRGTSTGVY